MITFALIMDFGTRVHESIFFIYLLLFYCCCFWNVLSCCGLYTTSVSLNQCPAVSAETVRQLLPPRGCQSRTEPPPSETFPASPPGPSPRRCVCCCDSDTRLRRDKFPHLGTRCLSGARAPACVWVAAHAQ